MKYTSVSVHQLSKRTGKSWQARAKYKDIYGKWRETSVMLPNAEKDKTVDKTYKEYLKFQLDNITGTTFYRWVKEMQL